MPGGGGAVDTDLDAGRPGPGGEHGFDHAPTLLDPAGRREAARLSRRPDRPWQGEGTDYDEEEPVTARIPGGAGQEARVHAFSSTLPTLPELAPSAPGPGPAVARVGGGRPRLRPPATRLLVGVGVLVALYLLTAVGLYRSANGFPPVVPVPVTRVP